MAENLEMYKFCQIYIVQQRSVMCCGFLTFVFGFSIHPSFTAFAKLPRKPAVKQKKNANWLAHAQKRMQTAKQATIAMICKY